MSSQAPTGPYYLVLTGARENVGDHLIGDRGLALLSQLRPDRAIVRRDRHADAVEIAALAQGATAVVLLGGPALTHDVFPTIYPLHGYEDWRVPLRAMALGWSGRGWRNPQGFRFTPEARSFLARLERDGPISVRDPATERILSANGLSRVLMTGCTAWYELASLGQPLRAGPVEHIVFTVGARRTLLWQHIRVLQAIKATFPETTLTCSFHRGIGRTARRRFEGTFTQAIAVAARALGARIVDASLSLDRIAFYNETDLHVGYRVHGHLSFLSKRRPSVLIWEDGRGLGQLEGLGTPGVSAYEPKPWKRLRSVLNEERGSAFAGFRHLAERIDRSYKTMRQFVLDLP